MLLALSETNPTEDIRGGRRGGGGGVGQSHQPTPMYYGGGRNFLCASLQVAQEEYCLAEFKKDAIFE